MRHLTLKAATTTTTDLGEFEAIISTAAVDRERDVVDPTAMVRALHQWTTSGKKLPLAWSHSSAPEDQIGHVNPGSAIETAGEVSVTGWIDQSTERGAHAWRLIKSGTLGFSFGYLVLDAVKRDDGVRLIRALDVFEVSATTTPMNGDTRVLGWKGATTADREAPTLEQLRDRERDLGLDVASDGLKALERRMRAEMLTALGGEAKSLSASELRAKAERIAAEFANIQVAVFDA